jgi:Uma2 family endonuclease
MALKGQSIPLVSGGIVIVNRTTVMEKEVTSRLTIRMTPEEYLRLERAAEYKSEFYDGEVVRMPGASREHCLITINIAAALHSQLLDRPCEVYSSDLRVAIPVAGSYVYPDVAVVCSKARLEDSHFDSLLNPNLIIEVLSKSTERYDRERKLAGYRTIESLQEYVLVSQSDCRIEQYVRQPDEQWRYSETTDADGTVELSSILCRLRVSDVYRRVSFSGFKNTE